MTTDESDEVLIYLAELAAEVDGVLVNDTMPPPPAPDPDDHGPLAEWWRSAFGGS